MRAVVENNFIGKKSLGALNDVDIYMIDLDRQVGSEVKYFAVLDELQVVKEIVIVV